MFVRPLNCFRQDRKHLLCDEPHVSLVFVFAIIYPYDPLEGVARQLPELLEGVAYPLQICLDQPDIFSDPAAPHEAETGACIIQTSLACHECLSIVPKVPTTRSRFSHCPRSMDNNNNTPLIGYTPSTCNRFVWVFSSLSSEH